MHGVLFDGGPSGRKYSWFAPLLAPPVTLWGSL